MSSSIVNGDVSKKINGEDSDEVVEEKTDAQSRGAWGSQLEFILTCVGFAVGLGNVWRFPYLCFKNGGGAFLIPYVLMLVFIGMPMFYLELSFAQFASLGPIKIWSISPIFAGAGLCMLAVSWSVCMYYNIIIAWSIYYLFASMTSELPWANCDNPSWNDDRCITGPELKDLLNNETALNQTLKDLNMTSRFEFETPSSQFFYQAVLQMSGGLEEPDGVVWQLALTLMLSWLIIFLVLIKGIGSLGKVIYVVSLFPYVMMTILLVRGATLEGAAEGVRYYMEPNITKLGEAEVWSDAATQIFYSLSACTGGLIAMASYNKFSNNVFRDSIIIPIINCCTSIFAGFVIFCTLGYMADQKGVDISEVAEQGPGLVFIVYPEALSVMPVAPLWAILFFIMMLMLGFSTEFSTVESVFTTVMDLFPAIRKSWKKTLLMRGICIAIFYLISLPMVTRGGFYLFNLVDNSVSGFPLLLIGFWELSATQWVYGYDNFAQDMAMMLGKKPVIYYRICWLLLTPLLLLVIITSKAIQYEDLSLGVYKYPDSGQALYWLVAMFCMVWVPVVALVQITRFGGWEAIKSAARPQPHWGPALKENRTGRYALPPFAAEKAPIFTVQEMEMGHQNKAYDTSTP